MYVIIDLAAGQGIRSSFHRQAMNENYMELNEVIEVHKCFSIQYVWHWNFLTSINFVIIFNLKSILIQLLAFFPILTEIQK